MLRVTYCSIGGVEVEMSVVNLLVIFLKLLLNGLGLSAVKTVHNSTLF
jgi:hypothetical protein